MIRLLLTRLTRWFLFTVWVVAPLTGFILPAGAAEPLRVGMFTDFEPLVFKVSDEIQGVEVDFASLAAAELGRPLEVKTYRFQELIPALQNGEVDVIMSGLSMTEARSSKVRFVIPYMEIGQMAIVRRDDVDLFQLPGSLRRPNLRVGVHQGSTGETFVRNNYTDAIVKVFGGVESGLKALRNGTIDTFIHDSTTSWQLSRSFVNDGLQSLNENLTRESVAWAVHQDNLALQQALDSLMTTFHETGVVKEVLHRWLPSEAEPEQPAAVLRPPEVN